MPAPATDLHLAVAPHFTVHEEGDDRFLLFSEERSLRLRGEIYRHLLPLLNGDHTTAEIRRRMNGANIDGVLNRLFEDGQIVGVRPHAPMSRQAFWSAAGRAPEETEAALAAFTVAVLPLGRGEAANANGASALLAALAGTGLGTAAPETARLTVVLVDDYLDPALQRFAETWRERPWIPFKPGGRRVLLGPLIDGTKGCAACLVRRMAENRPNDGLIKDRTRTLRPARAWLQATLDLARSMAALTLTRLALGETSGLETALLAIDADTGVRTEHRHWLFPDCPSCSANAPSDVVAKAASIALDQGEVVDSEIGGWRTLSQEDALAKLEPIVSNLTGIVTEIVLAEGGEEGLYVTNALQATPTGIDHMENRRAGKPGAASGKGITAAQSRISCLAEALERYSCAFTGSEPRRLARLSDLGAAAVHPETLLGFSDAQYDDRETLNTKNANVHFIPERFRAEEEVEWTPVWSLTRSETRWIPTRHAFYDYRPRNVPGDHAFCHGDSNGCAAGATVAEATLQGLLELVERDAVALWWYNRLTRPGIALDGINDAFTDRMRAAYERRGRVLHLLDVTSDVGIPVVIAVTANKERGDGILMGFGAHFDPSIAAERALTELNQIMLLDTSGASADDATTLEHHLRRWVEQETLDRQPYLRPDPAVTLDVRSMDRPEARGIASAVTEARDRFEALGLEMLVLDYARTQMPLACVKVIVPGLRHFWARKGAGRLNDVPVAMGWLDHPNTEADLNPINFVL
ncbi:MAG: TOMM precursor leader peptide-binding protein [Pseudomonadota bacterium]